MRNTELEKLDGLVGEWTTTMSDAWFLEPPGVEVPGTTTIERSRRVLDGEDGRHEARQTR